MEAAGSYRIEWSIRARMGLFAIYEPFMADAVIQALHRLFYNLQ